MQGATHHVNVQFGPIPVLGIGHDLVRAQPRALLHDLGDQPAGLLIRWCAGLVVVALPHPAGDMYPDVPAQAVVFHGVSRLIPNRLATACATTTVVYWQVVQESNISLCPGVQPNGAAL